MKYARSNIDKRLAHCSNLRDQGRLERSLKCVVAVINAAKDNATALLAALILEGTIYRDLGRTDEALKTFERALRIASSRSFPGEKADIFRQQSYLLIQMGRPAEAGTLAFKSLAIAREVALKKEEVDAIACIGHVLENTREFQKALSWYQEGIDICDEHEFVERKATLLGDLGKVYGIIGELPESLSFLKKALKLSTKIGYEKVIISSLYRLGDSYRSIDDKEKAMTHYRQALQRSKIKGYRREQGDALYRLGLLEIANGNPDQALKSLSASLAIFEELGYLRQRIYCLLAIGHVLEQRTELPKALERYFSAFAIIQGNVDEHTDAFIDIADNIINACQKLGYLDEPHELSQLTDQLREYTRMSGVFEDFRKKEKTQRLMAKITKVVEKAQHLESNVYLHNGLSIDFNRRVVAKDKRRITMTGDQWKILSCLWKKKGQPCTRNELRVAIGVHPETPTRTIDVQVYKIRIKIGHECLPSVRGQGYSLLVPD